MSRLLKLTFGGCHDTTNKAELITSATAHTGGDNSTADPLDVNVQIDLAVVRKEVFEGSPVELKCRVSSPEIQIKWQKIEGTLPLEAVQKGTSLFILNAQFEDKGYYSCTPVNATDEEQFQSIAHLIVKPGKLGFGIFSPMFVFAVNI